MSRSCSNSTTKLSILLPNSDEFSFICFICFSFLLYSGWLDCWAARMRAKRTDRTGFQVCFPSHFQERQKKLVIISFSHSYALERDYIIQMRILRLVRFGFLREPFYCFTCVQPNDSNAMYRSHGRSRNFPFYHMDIIGTPLYLFSHTN